jgi:hypothetical protein
MRNALAIGSLVSLSMLLLFAPARAEPAPAEPLSKGQRTVTAGNSFHWWVPAILAQMAVDAGYKDHLHFGVSAIGSSRVIQHWDLQRERRFIGSSRLAGMFAPVKDKGL